MTRFSTYHKLDLPIDVEGGAARRVSEQLLTNIDRRHRLSDLEGGNL